MLTDYMSLQLLCSLDASASSFDSLFFFAAVQQKEFQKHLSISRRQVFLFSYHLMSTAETLTFFNSHNNLPQES